jgi:hypothetical protein
VQAVRVAAVLVDQIAQAQREQLTLVVAAVVAVQTTQPTKTVGQVDRGL